MDTLDRKKVVLGISGGVDSTAAALLLLKQGYEVYGLYFSVRPDDEEGKDNAFKALSEAYNSFRRGINAEDRFIYRDVSEKFRNNIISFFCSEYMNGRTPNPCIECNPEIKFALLTEAADQIGAYHIATGHYAKVIKDEKNGISYIGSAKTKKDQSYMLYRLKKETIKRIIFPLADVDNKDKTREIAESYGMSNADRSDSQEICFIDDNEYYVNYIERETGKRQIKGDFVDKSGNVLGQHNGISAYTVGQRKGLGIALGRPAFVININAAENRIVLGENRELFRKNVVIDRLFFTETGSGEVPSDIDSMELTAKIRYAAPRSGVKVIKKEKDTLTVSFEVPQRAMTPGQSLVFYDGDIVIGGGRISSTF